jgi:hypothetical protein
MKHHIAGNVPAELQENSERLFRRVRRAALPFDLWIDAGGQSVRALACKRLGLPTEDHRRRLGLCVGDARLLAERRRPAHHRQIKSYQGERSDDRVFTP